MRGAVLPQDDIGSGASLSLVQCLTRLIVRLEMRTQVAGVRHDLAAETQPLALIGGECGFDIGVSRRRVRRRETDRKVSFGNAERRKST